MLDFLFNSTVRSLCVGTLAFLSVQWIGFDGQSNVMAAGCHYHQPTESIAASDLPSGVIRIYEYGQFTYYKPIEAPCSGPSCKGSSPVGFIAPTISHLDDQRNPPVICQVFIACSQSPSDAVNSPNGNFYQMLRGDELLRPPCVN